MIEYAVIWHSPNSKLVGLCDSLKEARELAQKWRTKHPVFLISIYKEVVVG